MTMVLRFTLVKNRARCRDARTRVDVVGEYRRLDYAGVRWHEGSA